MKPNFSATHTGRAGAPALALLLVLAAALLSGTAALAQEREAVPMPFSVGTALAADVDPRWGPSAEGRGSNAARAPLAAGEGPEQGRQLFATAASTSRFLSTATFGARAWEIDELTGSSASHWFLSQLVEAPSFTAPLAEELTERYDNEDADEEFFIPYSVNTVAFWRYAVEAPDQLRQRMVFALSQLLVVSDFGGELLSDFPSALTYYRDILTEHAFGNYRDLLEAITYSPAMGYYLTYLGNLPQDDVTGRMPDENYARELLQLFSIGLVELNLDGTPRTDAIGAPLETYSNADITGLARVFTGLDLDIATGQGLEIDIEEHYDLIEESLASTMVMYEGRHSQREKRFLGHAIPPGTTGAESLRQALDHIMAHPNVGPFIGRQLIQRFTTSHPSRTYVRRVAQAFNSGRYTLPDETVVGDGRKGDLTATIAAVLFDPAAGIDVALDSHRFGKPREPLLRLAQWARAFEVDGEHPEYTPLLWETLDSSLLAQHPHRSRSVFNFYRPGYVPPGTIAARRGMTVPEMQIVNASSIPGYVNTMTYFIFAIAAEGDEEEEEELLAFFDEAGVPVGAEDLRSSFVPRYEEEIELAEDPEALVAHLDLLLAHGTLGGETKANITDFVRLIPLDWDEGDGAWLRAAFAVFMTMTSPDYLVQR